MNQTQFSIIEVSLMESEHSIQKKIELVVSQHHCHIFRANVGKIRTPDGRFFTTGLPSGYPDLHGWRDWDHQAFYIEVKNATGKPRPDQIAFHKMLMKFNVIHGIARNTDDALKIVENGLVGYGY